VTLGSSGFVDSETTHEIPHIFDCVNLNVLGVAMLKEDKQQQSCEIGRPAES
jgi:hypothetical protein